MASFSVHNIADVKLKYVDHKHPRAGGEFTWVTLECTDAAGVVHTINLCAEYGARFDALVATTPRGTSEDAR